MDIKLSKRMQAVADMVKEKKVVDIGCDHAFVSIYLAQRSSVEKVIAMDVKTGPVDIARANVSAYNLSHKIDVRMSDGFSSLKVGEADVAIIAGMGGYLMIDILKKGKEHLKQGINLILQPQSDIRAVREYLVAEGYSITCEDMLIDDGKYYTIMRAVPALGERVCYTTEGYSYGEYLLDTKHPVLKSYLEHVKNKALELKSKLELAGTEKSQERILQLRKEIDDIDNILQKYFDESI